LQANPSLSALITKTLGSDDYLTNSMLLKGLEKYADDVKFQRAFYDCKLANKERLAHYIEETQGRKINRDALFDIQVKRIHAYKRQVSLARSDRSWPDPICRPWTSSDASTATCSSSSSRPRTARRSFLECPVRLACRQASCVWLRLPVFGGKAAPGYYRAKLDIKLINAVGNVIDADKDIDKSLFQVCFLPDYSVSLAEIITPASDISEHISTAGTEASGTSNMKVRDLALYVSDLTGG
jgi:starch phosphorylase